MTIDIKDFLNILTYNSLFEYVDLPPYIAAHILQDDPSHNTCFCETTNIENVRVWYPVESWIKELRRRKELETELTNMSRLHVATKPIERIEDIQQLIVKATIRRDFEEVNKLNDRLQKLTSSI